MAVLFPELQLASVVFHDLSGNAESQSDAFAHLLGGEKRLHDLAVLQLHRKRSGAGSVTPAQSGPGGRKWTKPDRGWTAAN